MYLKAQKFPKVSSQTNTWRNPYELLSQFFVRTLETIDGSFHLEVLMFVWRNWGYSKKYFLETKPEMIIGEIP